MKHSKPIFFMAERGRLEASNANPTQHPSLSSSFAPHRVLMLPTYILRSPSRPLFSSALFIGCLLARFALPPPAMGLDDVYFCGRVVRILRYDANVLMVAITCYFLLIELFSLSNYIEGTFFFFFSCKGHAFLWFTGYLPSYLSNIRIISACSLYD